MKKDLNREPSGIDWRRSSGTGTLTRARSCRCCPDAAVALCHSKKKDADEIENDDLGTCTNLQQEQQVNAKQKTKKRAPKTI